MSRLDQLEDERRRAATQLADTMADAREAAQEVQSKAKAVLDAMAD